MQAFTSITGISVPLMIDNIDTDMIIPKQFLKTIARTGLAAGLFYELRFDETGAPKNFVLDQERYASPVILVSGQNFGCGSSREHAPWSLLDHGFRCVIAPSFADIFFGNCFKNGILPIVLSQEQVLALAAQSVGGTAGEMSVDLNNQTITTPSGEQVSFEVDPFRKRCLLKGLDEIALTLEKSGAIDAFEERQRRDLPWLYS